MSQSIDKGPAILILLLVAFGISGVGVALDGKVLPHTSDGSSIIENAAAQSESPRYSSPANENEASEVSRQLKRAIDAASRNETESFSALEERAAESKAKIDDLNQLLVEKGGSGPIVSDSEKAGQFNRQLGELKTRLGELQQSR